MRGRRLLLTTRFLAAVPGWYERVVERMVCHQRDGVRQVRAAGLQKTSLLCPSAEGSSTTSHESWRIMSQI